MSFDGFWLSDGQFARLAPHLPTNTRGVPRVDDRRVISGIIHVLQSGCRWRDAPAAYGPHKTLYNRFVRWAARGVWDNVFEALAQTGGPATPVIPNNPTRKRKHPFDRGAHRMRNVIERTFARLKDWRRVATRYDKLATNFRAAALIAATIIYWL